jgi:hypothetical protein
MNLTLLYLLYLLQTSRAYITLHVAAFSIWETMEFYAMLFLACKSITQQPIPIPLIMFH